MKNNQRLKRWSAAMLTVPMLTMFASSALAKEDMKVHTPPKSAGSGVFYEIYINSFYDSNGDGHGDLKGISQKLNYLNDGKPRSGRDLEVSGLWLMPLNPSPSYHKYDVTDYYQVDPQYGTMDDFRSLMKEAHKKGVKVIMDLVINHSSSEHPWFKEASTNPNSKYHDYYVWADEHTDLNEKGSWGQQVWYKNPNGEGYFYSTFWSGMPDLNFDNPNVRQEMLKVGKYWLQQGVDGFRLDAAMHIYPGQTKEGAAKNLVWWNEFRSQMKKVNPNVYLAGEVWDKPETIAPYFGPLNSLFNFDLGGTILNSVKQGKDQGIAAFADKTLKLYKSYNPAALDAPFLSNHDQTRVMSELGGNVQQAKLAASILLTMPGQPFLYYGEEIGMMGEKPDEYLREPMRWYPGAGPGQATWEEPKFNTGQVSVEAQLNDSNSLLNTYRTLIRLREEHEALRSSHLEPIQTSSSSISAYKRTGGTETLVVYHNLSGSAVTLQLKGLEKGKQKVIYSSSKSLQVKKGNITIPAYSSVIIQDAKKK
ncbi:alpha-amylase family glycosyl hydrolase [Paenibacillus sp. JX-17]|uniref:Alpha-amylase n=1 Tax=Paenibacillus lacisoli TaxID=3064525 RepID=A0ABT9CFA8_9BACL|nr:alpha-amylase family glycosyl hydrolase [Paenibacillus sp. JX-17]MDO7907952.1 alpha-amylase family glycosyl hydrolase [Paenibacillus sp. JX-17]